MRKPPAPKEVDKGKQEQENIRNKTDQAVINQLEENNRFQTAN